MSPLQPSELMETKKMQSDLKRNRFGPPQDKGRLKALWGKSRPVLHLGRQLTNDRL